MALEYDELMTTSVAELNHSYSEVETLLYAQSVGLGRDPVDSRELPFVYEDGLMLQTLPSMATVLVPDLIPADFGWDYTQVLHAEQRLTLHRPLPPEAELTVSKRVLDVCDGGFGGSPGKGPAPHRAPRRPPDLSCELATRSDQALLFRLNGDRNPLHADPATARAAGFPRPILHGLCTYGVACHAILQTICNYDPTLISGLDARFSAPVFPGDTIRTDMWQDGNIVSFQCTATERDSLVIRNGKCTLTA